MNEHALVGVEPVDVGYEVACRCGHTEWGMTEAAAVAAFDIHLDRQAVSA